MESQTTLTKETLTFSDLMLISHALGVDLLKAVMSLKLRDKKYPISFYRNYYNASPRQVEIVGIDKLIEKGFLEQNRLNNKPVEYYHVTEKGIEEFRKEFHKYVIYKSKADQDINYLKHRINFYCTFYNYRFCDDNSEHIIDYYKKYWLNKQNVSHTTEDVIRRFEPELKKFFKPKTTKDSKTTTRACSRDYIGVLFCPYHYTSCKQCPNFK